jgi:hypothetical protein
VISLAEARFGGCGPGLCGSAGDYRTSRRREGGTIAASSSGRRLVAPEVIARVFAPLLGLVGVFVDCVLNGRREDRALRRELAVEAPSVRRGQGPASVNRQPALSDVACPVG